MSKFQLKLVKDRKPRSNFNLSFVNRFTCNPMLAVPVACIEALPDDTFITEITNRITTDSLLSPALANFKVSFHQFFCPTRLYSKALSDNSIMVSNKSLFERNLDLPKYSWPSQSSDNNALEYLDRYKVKPCSLADMLGFPVGFLNMTPDPIEFNATPVLAYYDIVRNYFVHKQAGYVPIINSVLGLDGDTPVPVPAAVQISRLDDMVSRARQDSWSLALAGILTPSSTCGVEFGGLACTTFMPDQFTNFLSNETVAKITDLVRVDVQGEVGEQYMTIDTLRYANKLQRYLEVSVLGGNSTYSDWLHAHWGVDIPLGVNRPEYLGSTTSWVKFGEVISTSNITSEGSDSVTGLGDRGGVGFGAGRSKKRRYNFKENGYYMVIMTIVPEIDYAQGIGKALLKTSFSDLYVPELDGLGFQDIGMFELNALPNRVATTISTGSILEAYVVQDSSVPLNNPAANPFTTSIGKQPAWMEYMTKQNELHGRLVPSGDLGYWALSRTFFAPSGDPSAILTPGDRNPVKVDTYYRWTPYGYPWEFNYLFNNTDQKAQNFICEVKFDIVAKRQISKNIRPSL